MEMQLHMNKKEEDKAIKKLKVKLPILVITRFNGTHINSFRFWNQFKEKSKTNQKCLGSPRFFILGS